MSKRLMSFLLALLTVAACNTPIAHAAAAGTEDTTPPVATETAEAEDPAAETETPEDPDAAETAEPAEEAEPAEAAAPVYTSTLYVAGSPVLAGEFAAVKGSNYITLAAAMRILDPEAVVNQANGVATVTTRGITIKAALGSLYIEANGRYLYVPNTVQAVGDLVAIPAKTLADIFNMDARYDSAVGVAFLEAVEGREPVLTAGDAFYNAYDLDLLAHIIYNEAGNQTLTGKIAIGNVVMNRVKSPLFPNTVEDVIYQKNQFVPRGSKVMTRTVNEQSWVAAKLVMEGVVVMPNAFFFNTKGLKGWISQNRTYVTTIGNIDFYA